jgi:hypothetical protein
MSRRGSPRSQASFLDAVEEGFKLALYRRRSLAISHVDADVDIDMNKDVRGARIGRAGGGKPGLFVFIGLS